METTIEASTTRVVANKPPSSGTVVMSNLMKNKLRLQILDGPTSIDESSTSLTENGENEGPLDDLKIVAPLGDSGAPPTSSTVPPSVTHDQESSLVAAAHGSSSVSDIHNSSLVTAVHDSLATAVHDSLVTVIHDSLVAAVHESLVVAVDEVIVDKAPPPASSDLIGVDDKDELNEDENIAQKNTFFSLWVCGSSLFTSLLLHHS
ncbi:hypothetical protein Bca52824_082792 [Brassica carinata]|uniref:Uncharacterized protein n=1 Tax=Brassica carinata TaxID=52824 RepID=A0A8X7PIW2_BRACI|nr:hypothetical protein Bca52824_082792 [Brassica carinata]